MSDVEVVNVRAVFLPDEYRLVKEHCLETGQKITRFVALAAVEVARRREAESKGKQNGKH